MTGPRSALTKYRGLIWIQTTLHSDDILEDYLQVNFEKNSADIQK